MPPWNAAQTVQGSPSSDGGIYRVMYEQATGILTALTTSAAGTTGMTDLDGFWSAAAEFVGVRFHRQPTAVLDPATVPGARWFPGATLNDAEHAPTGQSDAAVAVLFEREDPIP